MSLVYFKTEIGAHEWAYGGYVANGNTPAEFKIDVEREWHGEPVSGGMITVTHYPNEPDNV